MINNPQPRQQQIGPFHLILSVVILLLTAYPYLSTRDHLRYSVSAYSADEVNMKHISLDRFDVIETNDIVRGRFIIKRNIEYHARGNHEDAIFYTNSTEGSTSNIKFSSLGRQFNLILRKPQHLVTKHFSVTTLDGDGRERVIPIERDSIQIYNGFVEGDDRSSVTLAFDEPDVLMTAHIKTGGDIYIVEPSYLHKDSLRYSYNDSSESIPPNSKVFKNSMVVYRLYDHKQFNSFINDSASLTQSNLSKGLCYNVKLEEKSENSSELSTQNQFSSSVIDRTAKKTRKRSIEYLPDTEPVRDKTRCTLHIVADYLFYRNVGNGDLQTTINYILALVNRVNQIYLAAVWDTGDEQSEKLTNIGFTVQNITVHQEFSRISSSEPHYNMQTNNTWTAREYLDNFSRLSPPRHFCLAHLLTYRQFDTPVLGLAYVANPRFGTIGGICSPPQQHGDFLYKHNTGISTSKGISGEALITRQADLVVAHELGHNLGAEHDTSECRPSSFNGGAYLMHPFAVLGFERNNRQLSKCSLQAIGRVIKRKASTCFIGVVNHICGNGIIEDNEECDGGDIGFTQNDPCCDSTCRFTPGSQCSDRHSWCCSKCQIATEGSPCRPAEEYNCRQAGFCDGRSADCPESPPVGDGQSCVGRGLCRGGECQPFCEARGLFSCLCTTPTDACKLCCRSTANGTCVPYNLRAPLLPDGVLCYRGICEKGRCEQPIQDVVERLWDVIEDITFTLFVRFMRDNIILVVLLVSIPIWCIVVHYINEFDKKIKTDVVSAIAKKANRRRQPSHSAFLPRIFVGDDISNSVINDDTPQYPFGPLSSQV